MKPWGFVWSIAALATGVSLAASDNRSDEFYDAIRNNARTAALANGNSADMMRPGFTRP